jgi:N-methylhydantoinase B
LQHRAASFGDFSAQAAANRLAERRLGELAEQSGLDVFRQNCEALQAYARTLARSSLRELPEGRYEFTDLLDDDGLGTEDIALHVALDIRDGRVRADFSGTAEQVAGNLNCPLPVTAAAVFYVFRCLMPPQVPPCHGAMADIELFAPPGCLVNAEPPAAVAAGNVETSTRIVDVVCGALAQALPDRIPAAAQGTMNNLAMGSRGPGGWDYYETLAGGHGACADANGLHARHSHMTNTLNTPVEVLELNYPLRIERYAIRRGSGGGGRQRGGDGVIREYRFLSAAEITILSERRRHPPWGLQGGAPGAAGCNLLDGETVGGKLQRTVSTGQLLRVETPGGGGFGA